MVSTARTLTAALLFASLAASAEAGKLAMINPRLRNLDVDVNRYTATPTTQKVSVPKEFLDKSYLYGGMVEAATDNCLTIGTGADPIKVRFKVEGDALLMLADQRDRVPDIGASSEDVLNRYPLVDKGATVEIDFAHPEVNNVSLVIGNSGYEASRPGYIYDVQVEKGFLCYGEKFIVQNQSGDGELPSRITLAIKYYLRESAPGAYAAKTYTDEDFSKYGFFLTTKTSRNENGTTEEKELVDRRDLKKKITYILSPSIPQKFRKAFREAILTWNPIFKKSHGIEPVEVVDGTDAQTPGDVRCNVLYWVDYATPFGGGAIGPHMSDPDTGEILDADVIFYAGAFRDEIAGMRKEAAAASKPAKEGDEVVQAIRDLLKGVTGDFRRSNRGFSMSLGSGRKLTFDPGCEYPVDEASAITARAHADITTMDDDQAMERIIREVIPHEIGHTLGLRHNFRATADLKNLPEGLDSTTVMDYQNSLAGLLAPGPYDQSAIAYGYDGDKTLHEGKEFFFATDGSMATDPLSNQFDVGDPLDFYIGQFKHYLKLRDLGFFRSFASYGRAQRKNLESIRKFVGKHEQSKKAWEFLVGTLIDKGADAPYNAIERLQAMLVLTSQAPVILARYNPRAQFSSLNEAQTAMIAQALVKNVVPDGKDIFELRLAMVESLKGMNNIYGFKALEAIGAAYKKAMDQSAAAPVEGGKPPQQLPPREQELAIRIQQAVGNYFAR